LAGEGEEGEKKSELEKKKTVFIQQTRGKPGAALQTLLS
jgi:hypothetical protein